MKSTAYTGPEPTVEQLRRQFGWMWARCGIDCAHYAALPLGCIAARVGADAPASALRRRLRCTRCGRRGAELRAPSVVDRALAPLPLDRVPEALHRQMAREALLSIGVGLTGCASDVRRAVLVQRGESAKTNKTRDARWSNASV